MYHLIHKNGDCNPTVKLWNISLNNYSTESRSEYMQNDEVTKLLDR